MKLILGFLLIVWLSIGAFSQSFVPQGEFGITVNDRIKAHKFLNDGKQLLLVGDLGTVTWDVENNEILLSVSYENKSGIEFKELSADSKFVLSGSRILNEKPFEFSPASIYAVENGKKIHTFDQSISDGFWSKNNQTFIGSERGELSQGGNYIEKAGISLFDGKSFKLRQTLNFEKLFWVYLSEDGEKLFTHSRDAQKLEKIELWDAKTGKLKETLFTAQSNALDTRPLLSRTNKYFGIIAKQKNNQKTLYIWSTEGNPKPVYQIAGNIKSSDFLFSSDERSVALDTGKNLEIYDLETQRSIAKTSNSSLPDYWIGNNSVFLYSGMKGYEVAKDRLLFAENQIYRTQQEKDIFTNVESTITTDETFTIRNPNDKYFLTYSNNLLKVYTSKGLLVEKLVSLPSRPSKNVLVVLNRQLEEAFNIGDTTKLFARANWSEDGKYLYTISPDLGLMKIWTTPEK